MSADALLMRIVCAWCKREVRAGAEPTSHGICDACKVEVEKEYESLKPRMGEQTDEAKQQQ
jgi:CRISPR/Cas system-associated protein Cas10 (large subunit of type III CRISPR-Cas system)